MNNTLARGLTATLDRTNHTDDPVVQRLRTQLQERDNLIADLRQKIRELTPSLRSGEGAGGVRLNNRPTLTPAQAAHLTGLHQSTISRYLTSGHWQGAQLPGSNRWLIYADQPLSRKRKGITL